MSDEKDSSLHDHHNRKLGNHGSGGNAVHGMGLIGTAIYFIQHAATFWAGVLGIFKAIIWPALLVYKFLEYLKM
jgi:hypothetical protein